MKLLSDIERDLLKLAFQKFCDHKIQIINFTALIFIICLMFLLSQTHLMLLFNSITLSVLPFLFCLILSSSSFYIYISIYTRDFENLRKSKFLVSTIKEIALSFGYKILFILSAFLLLSDAIIATLIMFSSDEPVSNSSQSSSTLFIFSLYIIMPIVMFLSNIMIMNLQSLFIGRVSDKIGVKNNILEKHLLMEYLKPIIKYSLLIGFIKMVVLITTNFSIVFDAFVIVLNVFVITIMVLFSLGERPREKERTFSCDFAMQM